MVAVVDRAVEKTVEVAADQKSRSKVSVLARASLTVYHFMKM